MFKKSFLSRKKKRKKEIQIFFPKKVKHFDFFSNNLKHFDSLIFWPSLKTIGPLEQQLV